MGKNLALKIDKGITDNTNLQYNNNNNNNPLIPYAHINPYGIMETMKIIDYRAIKRVIMHKIPVLTRVLRYNININITENQCFPVILRVNDRLSQRSIIITTVNQREAEGLYTPSTERGSMSRGFDEAVLKTFLINRIGGKEIDRRTERKEWCRK